MFKRISYQLPRWADQTPPDLPTLLHNLLRRGGSGEITVQLHKQEMEQLRRELRHANRRSFHATVTARR